MIRARLWALACGAGLAMVGCASTPLHYYTLVAPADGAATPMAVAASAPYTFELLPVGIPAQVDQPQLVVRQGGQGVALLDGQRWIAPLGDEIRNALSANLSRQLQTQDVSELPGNGKPVLRIKLDVRRFESQPGSFALIDAAWSLRLVNAPAAVPAVACTVRISETVGAGYDALVQGHQRAIAELAAQLATAARTYEAGQTPACPAN